MLISILYMWIILKNSLNQRSYHVYILSTGLFLAQLKNSQFYHIINSDSVILTT